MAGSYSHWPIADVERRRNSYWTDGNQPKPDRPDRELLGRAKRLCKNEPSPRAGPSSSKRTPQTDGFPTCYRRPTPSSQLTDNLMHRAVTARMETMTNLGDMVNYADK